MGPGVRLHSENISGFDLTGLYLDNVEFPFSSKDYVGVHGQLASAENLRVNGLVHNNYVFVSGANLEGLDFSKNPILETQKSRSHLNKLNLRRSNFSDSYFLFEISESDLSEGKFVGAYFESIVESKLSGADFRSSRIHLFHDAEVEGVDFSDAAIEAIGGGLTGQVKACPAELDKRWTCDANKNPSFSEIK